MGDFPTVCLKTCANPVRDMPAERARSPSVHARAGAPCMADKRRPHATVREGEEPARAALRCIGKVQPKRFYQQGVSNLLRDQGASWLRIAHLAKQALYCPLHRRVVVHQHDRRKNIQQVTAIAFQCKITAKQEKTVTRAGSNDAVISLYRREEFPGVSAGKGQIACDHELASVR